MSGIEVREYRQHPKAAPVWVLYGRLPVQGKEDSEQLAICHDPKVAEFLACCIARTSEDVSADIVRHVNGEEPF